MEREFHQSDFISCFAGFLQLFFFPSLPMTDVDPHPARSPCLLLDGSFNIAVLGDLQRAIERNDRITYDAIVKELAEILPHRGREIARRVFLNYLVGGNPANSLCIHLIERLSDATQTLLLFEISRSEMICHETVALVMDQLFRSKSTEQVIIILENILIEMATFPYPHDFDRSKRMFDMILQRMVGKTSMVLFGHEMFRSFEKITPVGETPWDFPAYAANAMFALCSFYGRDLPHCRFPGYHYRTYPRPTRQKYSEFRESIPLWLEQMYRPDRPWTMSIHRFFPRIIRQMIELIECVASRPDHYLHGAPQELLDGVYQSL